MGDGWKPKKHGLFGETVYITVGDPYQDGARGKEKADPRLKGVRQFQTQPQKRGQTADNWGQKKYTHKPLFDSNPLGKKEPYYAAGQFEMIDANKERKKCLQPDGFKYANPMKKSASVGDNFGAFSKLTYKEPFNPVKKGDPPRPVAEVPPNIKCNPIKKGSYGANWGCMLGPEYRYQSRPAAKEVEERRAIRLAHEEKIGGRNPFRGVCHPTAPSEKTMLEVYKAMPLPPEKPKPEKVELDKAPFYPPKVPKKGLAYCAMNPFPEYKSGGNFDEVQKAQRAAAAAEREKILVPFKAVSTPKQLYQVPVMTHPSNIHQNANLNLPSGTVNTTVAGEGK